MLRNINTGWGGVRKRPSEEILILVSSLRRIDEQGLQWVFTDSHAYYQWANYYTDLADLDKIDWPLLQRRDFKRDPDDPAKFERYQAEALVHRHVPIDALLGIVCYTDGVKQQVDQQLISRGITVPTHARTAWYF